MREPFLAYHSVWTKVSFEPFKYSKVCRTLSKRTKLGAVTEPQTSLLKHTEDVQHLVSFL